MNYLDFENRWLKSGGAERANYALFLQDLCDLLGVPRPDPTTDRPAQDAYVLERAVTFDDGGGQHSVGRIDLYKRGCFVLETKQGVDKFTPFLRDEDADITPNNIPHGSRTAPARLPHGSAKLRPILNGLSWA